MLERPFSLPGAMQETHSCYAIFAMDILGGPANILIIRLVVAKAAETQACIRRLPNEARQA